MNPQMTIDEKKIALIRLIAEIQDGSTIDEITAFASAASNIKWNDLSDLEKEGIEIGIKLLKEGKSISLEDFLKKVS